MAGLAKLVFLSFSLSDTHALDRRDAGASSGLGLTDILTKLLCARCGVSERQRTGRIACPTYCVAGTMIGSAVLLQPFISILPSGRTVPVIMPVVLNGV